MKTKHPRTFSRLLVFAFALVASFACFADQLPAPSETCAEKMMRERPAPEFSMNGGTSSTSPTKDQGIDQGRAELVPPANERSPGKIDERVPQLFHAGEFQLDLNGTMRTEDVTDLDDANYGAGVGFNYFPWRAAGFGAELSGEGTDGLLVDQAAVALIGRLPLDKLRLAPEFKVGSSYAIESEDFAIFAAVGIEWRILQHGGIGVEVRGTRPISGAEGECVTAILRLRANF